MKPWNGTRIAAHAERVYAGYALESFHKIKRDSSLLVVVNAWKLEQLRV